MVDKDPQDVEIISVIRSGGDAGFDPQALIDTLVSREYELADVIEALQRAIERGKISLNGEGMVISLMPELAHAA
nr:hypothetical protein [Novosphingobium panipatense]